MSILAVLGVLSFVSLSIYTFLLKREVARMDEAIHYAFEYTGTIMGELLVRTNNLEIAEAAREAAREVTDALQASAGFYDQVSSNSKSQIIDSYYPKLGVIGAQAANDPDGSVVFKPLDNGRGLPNTEGY